MRFRSVLILLLMFFATVVPSLVVAAGPTLNIGAVNGNPGQTVTVPVTFVSNGGSFSAISVDIGFDPSKLSVAMITATPPYPTVALAASAATAATAANKSVVQSLPAAGVLRLGIFGFNSSSCNENNNPASAACNKNVIQDGVVANVIFTIAANATGTITLTNISAAADTTGSVNQVTITGTNGIILGPVTIGDNALIGAGAVVLSDVPANRTAVGVPARVLPRTSRRSRS